MNVGERYKEEYRKHLIEKYKLPQNATWEQINIAYDKAREEKKEEERQ